MSFAAFQIVRASQLNRIQPTEYASFQSGTGQQTITTTETDSAGCTVTFTTATAAVCTVWIFCDVEVTATGASVFQGRISVDGTTVTAKEAHVTGLTLTRVTAGQAIDFTLSGAGSHTVKLRLLKTAAAATIVTDDNHTGFTLSVREVV